MEINKIVKNELQFQKFHIWNNVDKFYGKLIKSKYILFATFDKKYIFASIYKDNFIIDYGVEDVNHHRRVFNGYLDMDKRIVLKEPYDKDVKIKTYGKCSHEMLYLYSIPTKRMNKILSYIDKFNH